MLLTSKETQFMKLFKEGFSFEQIALEMNISINTVRSYKARIVKKYEPFGLRNFKDLARLIQKMEKETKKN